MSDSKTKSELPIRKKQINYHIKRLNFYFANEYDWSKLEDKNKYDKLESALSQFHFEILKH